MKFRSLKLPALASAMLLCLVGMGNVMAQPSVTAPGLSKVQKSLAPVSVLRGDFVQLKQVKGFSRPLRSKGNFLVDRQRGVQWNTVAPFASSTVITASKVLVRNADGKVTTVADSARQPAVRAINEMLISVMGGNVGALQKQFTVGAKSLSGASWLMVLKPRTATLQRAVAQIQLEGDRYVREVKMTEANGDTTVWSFSGLSQTPATLSAAERQRFVP